MYETPFSETNALLGVIRGDEEEAREILTGFLTGELESMQHFAGRLAELAAEELSTRNDAVPLTERAELEKPPTP